MYNYFIIENGILHILTVTIEDSLRPSSLLSGGKLNNRQRFFGFLRSFKMSFQVMTTFYISKHFRNQCPQNHLLMTD